MEKALAVKNLFTKKKPIKFSSPELLVIFGEYFSLLKKLDIECLPTEIDIDQNNLIFVQPRLEEIMFLRNLKGTVIKESFVSYLYSILRKFYEFNCHSTGYYIYYDLSPSNFIYIKKRFIMLDFWPLYFFDDQNWRCAPWMTQIPSDTPNNLREHFCSICHPDDVLSIQLHNYKKCLEWLE
jgi:hypothetical protein